MPRSKRRGGRGKKKPRAADGPVQGLAGELVAFVHPNDRLRPRRTEIKHFDTAIAAAVVTSASTMNPLSAIAQGVAGNQRVGDEATLRGVTIRYRAWGNSTPIRCALRVVVFCWNDDSASLAPSLANVLQNTSQLTAPYNWQSVQDGDIRVLADELHQFSSAGGPDTAVRHIELKLSDRLAFNTGVTTGSGQLYCLLWSDQATNGPSIELFARAYYTDS